jgi:acetylornithine deacetylase/succinyl-diaminopimelate desuccinylase-like protein
VNVETASEQLLYEVGDPAAYFTPDVVADFTSVTLRQQGPDVVAVSAAKGRPAPDTLKVSIAYRDGWAAAGTLVIAGPNAADKARRCGEMVRRRLARAGAVPEHFNVECLGNGGSLPGVLPEVDAPEVVLRIAVRDSRKAIVERFGRELAPLVTSGPPGVTGYTTGRPPVREVFAYWPALLPRDAVTPAVEIV